MPSDILRYANGNEGFARWLSRVDTEVSNELGLSIFDLPDLDYWAMYDAHRSTHSVARQIIEDALEDSF